jgi:hypothetical protein
LPRSGREGDEARAGRKSLAESREFDLGLVGWLYRAIRQPRPPEQIRRLEREGKNWKREWYARGDRVTVDASPFLAAEARAAQA